jgi:peptide deformylase
MGHPTLLCRAEPVADPCAPDIQALVRDMRDTMEAEGGIGIAAPQIGVSRRVILFHVPENGGEEVDECAGPLRVLVNPTLTPLSEDQEAGWEGCLSVPGLRGAVPRYVSVRYTGQTPEGETVDICAEGFHARVVQHEIDHLDGVLYPQRMTDMRSLVFTAAQDTQEESEL